MIVLIGRAAQLVAVAGLVLFVVAIGVLLSVTATVLGEEP